MEEYRKFFEDYEISNFGNCRRLLKTGEYRQLTGTIMNRGYRYIQVMRNKKRLNFLFHQQVAYCFIGERPGKLVIDHYRSEIN